ncbi:Golgi membrane exchange factor (Ric1p-Rgp1p) subunit [Entomophthora muscae]|uniref:Golgi membrane exchange factor (Ric1p-Rgp1p) subunit n=1 Tax=Entomophthora muscae TaxID=34485 RepID=A0ACC2SH61_9FUNG|nr:Golgi membrane exchange factor (Ric1p-Rgp1p) subunit [Entomophthora muscae]
MVHAGPFGPLKSKCMYRAATGLGNGGGTLGFSSNPFVSNLGYGNGISNFSGLTEFKRQENKRFPVFSSPPSVLFCNLKLNPGESKIFDYEVILPEGLPSTHRGKCIKILYYLIIGTQKGEITQEPSVVQLPFRLFAKVNDFGITPEYDLMEPILIHKDNSIIRSPTDAPRREPSPRKLFSTADEFLSKALETLSLSSAEADEGDEEDEGSLPYSNGASLENSTPTCLKAVYGITRKTKPVSYTFNKGDTVIGRMCLRRSFFRIGESIHILIHFLPSPIKCYQISVTLESYEQVVPEFACQSAARTDQLTRQILTQYHTLSTNADRSSFDLAIPNHCTPGFITSAVSLQYRLRLEFLVAERTLQNVASGPIDRHHTHNRAQLPIGVEPEKLVCLAPISLLPTHPAYAKTYKSFHSYNMS